MVVIIFNSWQYAIFLPLVVVGYYSFPHKWRWTLLLVASYYFYMSWNPNLVVLILFTTLTSYFAARGIEKAGDNQKKRKTILILGIACSLACLFFFKYFNFFSANIIALLRMVSLPVGDFSLKVMLPVGISFYTFQTLSYIIDVYRKDLKAEHHFGIYALYVSFFPQLVAGPIERATTLLPQFYQKHSFNLNNLSDGLRLILLGLFKKVLIADFIAVYVNNVYNNLQGFSGLSLWVAALLFNLQIYCDFSGYTDIAIGSAKILGFDLMENFRSPYTATSIKDFWRRWHISLSTWFSDYVYIPLGGSRVGKSRHLFNLFITFILSGLWHGASWNFVLWGALHGLALMAETFLLPRRQKRLQKTTAKWQTNLLSVWWWLLTMCIVTVGYILFRANTLADAFYVFGHLLQGINPLRIMEYLSFMGITPSILLYIVAMCGLLFAWDWINRTAGNALQKFKSLPKAARYTTYYLLAVLLLWRVLTLPSDAVAEFIYFQF